MPCSLFLQVIHNDIFCIEYYIKSVTSIIKVFTSVVRLSTHSFFLIIIFTLLLTFCFDLRKIIGALF
jgi:hypothetical protein